jgi:TolB protein
MNGRVVGLTLVMLFAACTGAGDPAERLDLGDGEHTPAATDSGATSGTVPDDGSQVLDPAGSDIYRVDPATEEIEQLLSSGEGGLDEPELSPEGSRLVYQGQAPNGSTQIFVLEDGRKRQLTELRGGALEPTWSPDGSQIAFAGRDRAGGGSHGSAYSFLDGDVGNTDILVMDADGGHVRRLAATPRPDRRPDWSPDGSRIVFDTGAYIWVVSVDDDEHARRLNPAIRINHGPAADPAWSPDGRWIAFTRFSTGSINGRIGFGVLWLMRPDGTSEHPLFPSKEPYGTYELDPSWSPDASAIAFSSGNASKIAIVDVRTGEIVHLDSVTDASDLSWDGRGILVSMGSLARPSPDPWPGGEG